VASTVRKEQNTVKAGDNSSYASSIATSGSSVALLSPFAAWNENVCLMMAETQSKQGIHRHQRH